MHLPPAQERKQRRDMDDPPILYLRTGIFVRDASRLARETTPLARDWDLVLALSTIAALGGCVLGLLLR